ncbi:MAG: 2-hydroxyacid dehydrogenase [Bacteroidota bacterium]
MKAVITAPFHQQGIDILARHMEVQLCGWGKTQKELAEDELIAAAQDCEVLITEVEDVTAKVIDSCPNLKLIGCTRTVPRNVDVDAATRKGIPVFHTPGRNAQSVAELTVLLMIGVARKAFEAERFVRDRKWTADGEMPYLRFRGYEMCDKVVGIVGFGAIGRKVAAICNAMGCKVVAFDPFVTEVPDYVKLCSLDELMQHADFVSVHCAVTEETRGMINRDLIAMMKPTAFFVNTARAAVVDEQALIEALAEKRIAGAGLDVFMNEPLPDDSPFFELDNCVLLPHIGGASHDVMRHHSVIISEAISDYLSGRGARCVANPEVIRG